MLREMTLEERILRMVELRDKVQKFHDDIVEWEDTFFPSYWKDENGKSHFDLNRWNDPDRDDFNEVYTALNVLIEKKLDKSIESLKAEYELKQEEIENGKFYEHILYESVRGIY